MNLWYRFGRFLSPVKHLTFRLIALVHKTTRPRVALVCGDEILLVKNWGESKWSLPGGGMHHGEESARAAIREVQEELGVQLDEAQLVYIDTFELATYYAPVFVVKLDRKPTIKRQKLEIHEARWFPKNKLPNSGKLLQKLSF